MVKGIWSNLLKQITKFGNVYIEYTNFEFFLFDLFFKNKTYVLIHQAWWKTLNQNFKWPHKKTTK